jgi:carboxypeptidase Q
VRVKVAMALMALGSAAAFGQGAAQQDLVKLGGQLMLAGKAYEYDRQLSDELGPRLTGSENYVKAADWAVGEFKRLGLTNARKDEWEIANTWEPVEWAEGRILSPREMRLHLESDGWGPSTPKGGVKGKVFYLKALTEEAVKAAAPDIKDAIVMVDGETLEASGESMWGKMIDAVSLVENEGAKAFLVGFGDRNNVPSMMGLDGANGAVRKIPLANVGMEDSKLLRRMLERGPVEVEFSFRNKVRERVKVPNVVADIPGTDGSGEYVLIGGHLDSWQLGTGAQDNGTGAASVMAVAEAVKASGIQPKRTLRFVLFGGEEEGLLGSIHYADAHAAELDKCAGVFVTDTGAEAPKGWFVVGREDERKAIEALKPLLGALGADALSDDGRFTFSTDHGPFLVKGVPVFLLWTPADEYRKIHHKPSDTFDKVNHRDLNLGAAVLGVTVLSVADAPAMLKHYSQSEMEEQLKKIKQYDEYKDMVDHKML